MTRRVPKPIAFLTLLGFSALLVWCWPEAAPRPSLESSDDPVAIVSTDVMPVPVAVADLVPAAMRDATTYASTRLREIKANPETWADVWTWRREFTAASTPVLQHEVVGLARQVGPDALLAVLAQALAAENPIVRLDAARSIALLPESRLRDGVSIGIDAADPEIRSEVMDLIAQVHPHLRPELLRITLAAHPLDATQRSVEMLTDQPSPELFDVLLDGLRSPDPEVRTVVGEAIDKLVQQRFESFEEASRWWALHRGGYDSLMSRIDGE